MKHEGNGISSKSKISDLEAGNLNNEKLPKLPPIPSVITPLNGDETPVDRNERSINRDESGMALNQAAALANLDPRNRVIGTSAVAEAGEVRGDDMPAGAIGVEKGFGSGKEK